MNTTIAAIATPVGTGGLGVIRISGENAHSVAQKVFTPIGERNVDNIKGFSAVLGKVHDNDGYFDDAIATVFHAPLSYTGENVAELSCHGGAYVLSRLLKACFNAGATPAQPGEFTKRAFLNGKLSLERAEAVIDIINARTKLAATAAYNAKEGALFRVITTMISDIGDIAAKLAVTFDYPDEDIDEEEMFNVKHSILNVSDNLNKLLSTYDNARCVMEGIPTAIVGKPNVGKSTLMNVLTKEDTSIVTEIAGTTRDIVERSVVLEGITLLLSDTAGIRTTDDPVEKIGVENAVKKIPKSHIVLAVFDAAESLTDEDKNIIELVKEHNCIAVINKSDLGKSVDTEYIESKIKHIVYISAAKQENITELSEAIMHLCNLHEFDPAEAMLYNERQRHAVQSAYNACEESINAIEMMMTSDVIAMSVEDILTPLLELTGERVSQRVVDTIFEKFCVGK